MLNRQVYRWSLLTFDLPGLHRSFLVLFAVTATQRTAVLLHLLLCVLLKLQCILLFASEELICFFSVVVNKLSWWSKGCRFKPCKGRSKVSHLYPWARHVIPLSMKCHSWSAYSESNLQRQSVRKKLKCLSLSDFKFDFIQNISDIMQCVDSCLLPKKSSGIKKLIM